MFIMHIKLDLEKFPPNVWRVTTLGNCCGGLCKHTIWQTFLSMQIKNKIG